MPQIINPPSRFTTLRFSSNIGSGPQSITFPVDMVVLGMSSYVSFNNVVPSTSAIVAIGFGVPRVSVSTTQNQTYSGVVHFYSHVTPLGSAIVPDTVVTQSTDMDPFILRSNQVVNMEYDQSGLKSFNGSFTVQHVPLSEWLSFVAPAK